MSLGRAIASVLLADVRPAAMERTRGFLEQERSVGGQTDPPPCDDRGVPVEAR